MMLEGPNLLPRVMKIEDHAPPPPPPPPPPIHTPMSYLHLIILLDTSLVISHHHPPPPPPAFPQMKQTGEGLGAQAKILGHADVAFSFPEYQPDQLSRDISQELPWSQFMLISSVAVFEFALAKKLAPGRYTLHSLT